MSKCQKTAGIIIFAVISILLMIATIIAKSPGSHGDIGELMRDAVLHETNKISLFGVKDVNPGHISAFTVTGVLFVFCLCAEGFQIVIYFIVDPGL